MSLEARIEELTAAVEKLTSSMISANQNVTPGDGIPGFAKAAKAVEVATPSAVEAPVAEEPKKRGRKPKEEKEASADDLKDQITKQVDRLNREGKSIFVNNLMAHYQASTPEDLDPSRYLGVLSTVKLFDDVCAAVMDLVHKDTNKVAPTLNLFGVGKASHLKVTQLEDALAKIKEAANSGEGSFV